MNSDAELEVQRSLGRIEGKLDDSLKRLDHQDTRIERLEHFKSRSAGYGAGALAVLTLLGIVLHYL